MPHRPVTDNLNEQSLKANEQKMATTAIGVRSPYETVSSRFFQ